MEKFSLQIIWILMYNVTVVTAQTNVALVSMGSQCESSQPRCEQAFDGVSAVTSSIFRWDFYGEAQGHWIKVTFNQTYKLYKARFMQLDYADDSNFKDLQLNFEDGTQQQVTLTIREDGFQWEEFTIDSPVETAFVDVFILTAYTTGRTYNGFSEIEFYDGLLTTTQLPTRRSQTAMISQTTKDIRETITESDEKDIRGVAVGAAVGAALGTLIILMGLGGLLLLFFKFRHTSNERQNMHKSMTTTPEPPMYYNVAVPQETDHEKIKETQNSQYQGFGQTPNELQNMQHNMVSPTEQPVYYNVAGPQNTEYEEIKESQDSPYQGLQGDVSDHTSPSQYQELQVVLQ